MPARFPILILAVALAGCTSPDSTGASATVTPAAPPASNALPTDGGPVMADTPGGQVALGGADAPSTDADLVAADTLRAPDSETERLFASIQVQAAEDNWQALPYGELVQRVGEALIGQPYVAGLLDEPESETLVVTLRAFDCVLYIENVLALAEGIATGDTSYGAYAEAVRRMRYRDGQMGAYCSRLHYFSDWIRDNEARGTVQNVTQSVGGEAFDKRITFMSEHRDAYPKLVADTTYACIVDMEADLAGVDLFYIPQARISEAYALLQPGDIIATATSIGGLDVTHTGFVHKTAEHTGFMHASLSSEEVKISDDLQSYVRGIPSQIGVVVARPRDPRPMEG